MKSSKAKKTSIQEECGVWLDTVKLKEKSKKKYTRPISKLLNPFTEGAGYSLAVALNFTQTKIEMPKTKQSTISTFFIKHRRVLQKISTSEEPNMDPAQPSMPSPSTTLTVLSSGRKRGRDVDHEEIEWKSENVDESQETPWHSSLPNMDFEFKHEKSDECEPPQSKRHPDSSLVSDSQLLPQTWSQDPLLTFSQYSECELCTSDERFNTAKNLTSFAETFRDSLPNEEAFKNVMNDKRTSTQRSSSCCHSPENDDDQENILPIHKSSVWSHNWTEPYPPSPQKHLDLPCKETEHGHQSQTEWMKPKSPLRKRAWQSPSDGDEESLEALFTQDSQGCRVIAHRGFQGRTPLKDQSNVSARTVKTHQPLVWEEDDVPFTQDSQGNVVIKH